MMTGMEAGAIELALEGKAATARLGEDIAAILSPGDLIALKGDLGAGKSTLARSVVRALAGDDGLEVPSPTFTLVQPYEARLPVLHVDLYRLGGPDEIEELGLEEALAGSVVLIEWFENAHGRLGEPSLTVTLSGTGPGRHAILVGPALPRVRRSLEARRFLDAAGAAGARRRHLAGDASTRAYETVQLPDRPDRILMNAPRQPDGPPIRDGLPYSRIAHLAESVVPFVAIDRLLLSRGFRAPRIDAADLDAGFLLIEHLGDRGVLDAEGRPIRERYLAAAELLAHLHGCVWPAEVEVAPGHVYEIPRYDEGALAIETELLIDWYLPRRRGRPVTDAERAAFAKAWRSVFALLGDAERSLVLRDYHSPNLIWREDRAGLDGIGLIDFQDALIGPSAYDVASLAQDARVTIAPRLETEIVEAYAAARAAAGAFDRRAFDRDYAIMAAQRATKILGIFVRLKERDGKSGYLRHLPRIHDYLRRSLVHPALAPVAGCYDELGIAGEGEA
jgi:N-acetylmuramate 1-kinase